MEIIKVGDKSYIKKAITVLNAGGVILYPTDTLYGLGADALSDEAVAKVYAIKGRDERKPIHAIVADMAMMEEYAEVNDYARLLAKKFLPGPLTLILKKRKGIETGIVRGVGTIGVRIPAHPFCLALSREFGKPFTTTSANRSGRKTERTVRAILEQLGANNSYASVLQKTAITKKTSINLVIDAGELPERQPSTVVDLSGNTPIILREGGILAGDIWEILRLEC